MEPEGSLPHSQEPAMCPYPEPDRSSPTPPPPSSHCLKTRSNIILPYMRGFSRLSPFVMFSHLNVCNSPHIRVTCPAHLILLCLITWIIFGEDYRAKSQSLPLHTPATSSLLDPTILLSTLFSKTLSLQSSVSVSDQVSRQRCTACVFKYNAGAC
jgi:hypothetical protein